MKIINLRQTFLLAIFGVLPLIFVGCKKAQNNAGTNIVYILTDQWRASALGYAGDPNVKTPNLDKFSEEAVNFLMRFQFVRFVRRIALRF